MSVQSTAHSLSGVVHESLSNAEQVKEKSVSTVSGRFSGPSAPVVQPMPMSGQENDDPDPGVAWIPPSSQAPPVQAKVPLPAKLNSAPAQASWKLDGLLSLDVPVHVTLPSSGTSMMISSQVPDSSLLSQVTDLQFDTFASNPLLWPVNVMPPPSAVQSDIVADIPASRANVTVPTLEIVAPAPALLPSKETLPQ
eukprot:CAMPEP_0178641124 /NCGR_PEP_ID=MMETSP0698-20121128/16406_1 /TAXON_ID=265572 /ORGANISM="Extubocellulus spinifer, Strain CCMP396" /LENGTH=194 /DNA_ID=CAMNT_0020281657 /DNA_START=79 /DNA_END=663 /DNA_ORIENTATION=-